VINGKWTMRLHVAGAHNAVNAAAAFAVCRQMGFSGEQIVDALASFRLPELRMGVKRFGPITVIDDCYNANPTSMKAALDVLRRVEGGRRVLIAGEMAELGESSERHHRAIGREAARAGVSVVVAVGESARALAQAASGEGPVESICCAHATEAASRLREVLRADDTVLIKGSRSSGLERLAARIRDVFGEIGEGDRSGSACRSG
jgi:UDP-N-acetylmuramoyl-tripeptide--D-alanyl-D-alanine ligase